MHLTKIALILWMVVFIGQVSQAAGPEVVGRVQVVNGNAAAFLDTTMRVLHTGDALYKKDVLVTGCKCALQVMLKDGTLLTMSGASRIQLQEIEFDPKEGAACVVLDFMVGNFRFATGASVEVDQDHFQVNTPMTTIGIRGTEVGVILVHASPGLMRNLNRDLIERAKKGLVTSRNEALEFDDSQVRSIEVAHLGGEKLKSVLVRPHDGIRKIVKLGKYVFMQRGKKLSRPTAITPDVRERYAPARFDDNAKVPLEFDLYFKGYPPPPDAEEKGEQGAGKGKNSSGKAKGNQGNAGKGGKEKNENAGKGNNNARGKSKSVSSMSAFGGGFSNPCSGPGNNNAGGNSSSSNSGSGNSNSGGNSGGGNSGGGNSGGGNSGGGNSGGGNSGGGNSGNSNSGSGNNNSGGN